MRRGRRVLPLRPFGRGRTGNPSRVLELYQAEWCPSSARVRARLTELGVDVVARQVEPRAEERAHLRAVAGVDSIPVLVLESGETLDDADAILAWLDEHVEEPPTARGHRAQARAHA